MSEIHTLTYRSRVLPPYLILANTIALDNTQLIQMGRLKQLLKPVLFLCPFPPTVEVLMDKEDYFQLCLGFRAPYNYEKAIHNLTAEEAAKLLYILVSKGLDLPEDVSDPMLWAKKAYKRWDKLLLNATLDRVETWLDS